MPGLDWGGLLDRKYNILATTANANANLANTQAAVLPGTAASEARLRAAQAHGLDVTSGLAPTLANSLRNLQGAQAEEARAQANTGVVDDGSLLQWMNAVHQHTMVHTYPKGSVGATDAPFGAGLDFAPSPVDVPKLASGTAKVPGKGDGTVDKVPAVLAPGEAVLNKHAAELIGRDKIAAANAVGVEHMKNMKAAEKPMAHANKGKQLGSGAPKGPQKAAQGQASKGKPNAAPAKKQAPLPAGGKPQGLAKGTHQVGVGKSAKTPSKLSPGALASLASMLGGGAGGGGGMAPAPGGMPPMPGKGMA